MGKPVDNSFFIKDKNNNKPNRKNGTDSSNPKPSDTTLANTKKKKSYENLSKRTSRKEMIAKREKFKLKNNLNKQLRYERKHQQQQQQTNERKKPDQNVLSNSNQNPNQRNEKGKGPLSSFKKAQLEYEKKQEEKRKRKEVSDNRNSI